MRISFAKSAFAAGAVTILGMAALAAPASAGPSAGAVTQRDAGYCVPAGGATAFCAYIDGDGLLVESADANYQAINIAAQICQPKAVMTVTNPRGTKLLQRTVSHTGCGYAGRFHFGTINKYFPDGSKVNFSFYVEGIYKTGISFWIEA